MIVRFAWDAAKSEANLRERDAYEAAVQAQST
jgi:hypothetical protein